MAGRGLMRAALVALCCASSAWAIGEREGVKVQEAGTTEAGGNPARTMDFDGGDFDVTCSAGTCDLALGPNAVINNGGDVGAAADFESIVDLSGKTLYVPNGTADRADTCTAGSVYLESDDSTTTATGTSVCRTTDTWAWVGDIVSGGLSGGQTINGGTGEGDDLDLRSGTDTSPTGRIELCDGAPTMGDNTACVEAFPGGYVETPGANNQKAIFEMDSTVSQSESLFITDFSYINAAHTWDLVDGAGSASFIGNQYLLRNASTIKNSSNAGTVVPGVSFALVNTPSCSVADGATAITVSAMGALTGTIGTIGSNCTVSDFYVGGRALAGGTVSGTLTRWRGFHVDAPGVGSDRYQYSAKEHTITATAVPAGEGAWGVQTGESTNPARFYYVNESEQIWRLGYIPWTMHCTGLLGNTNTYYCEPVADGRAASTTEANEDMVAPGAMDVYAIACGVSVAPDNGAGTQARIFTLRDDGGATTITCTISETATSCSGRVEAGVSVAAASMLAVEVAPTGTPAAAEATCTIIWNLDVW